MSNKDWENVLGFVQFLFVIPVVLAGLALVVGAIWEGIRGLWR